MTWKGTLKHMKLKINYTVYTLFLAISVLLCSTYLFNSLSAPFWLFFYNIFVYGLITLFTLIVINLIHRSKHNTNLSNKNNVMFIVISVVYYVIKIIINGSINNIINTYEVVPKSSLIIRVIFNPLVLSIYICFLVTIINNKINVKRIILNWIIILAMITLCSILRELFSMINNQIILNTLNILIVFMMICAIYLFTVEKEDKC